MRASYENEINSLIKKLKEGYENFETLTENPNNLILLYLLNKQQITDLFSTENRYPLFSLYKCDENPAKPQVKDEEIEEQYKGRKLNENEYEREFFKRLSNLADKVIEEIDTSTCKDTFLNQLRKKPPSTLYTHYF